MYQIPTQDGKWIQTNRGDATGNLLATWNMDFDSVEGRVRVSPRTRINTDSGDDSDLGLPIAFLRTDADGTDRWWALCGTKLFKTAGTNPSATFTQDDIANSPTTNSNSDMEEFNGNLYVSTSNNIAENNSGTWTASWWQGTLSQSALGSHPHVLKRTVKTGVLLISDGNLIHRIDTSENVSTSRVVLPDEFEIRWIECSRDGTWIGTENTTDGEAQVFFWNESAENYNYGYGIKSDVSMAGVIKDGIPYTVNRAGQLLGFSGSGFVELAVFPIFGREREWYDESVHRNGMAIIDNDIHILANFENGATKDVFDLIETFPSGIWIFNENRGLTHKYPITRYDGTEFEYGVMYNILGDMGALVSTARSDGLFLAGSSIQIDPGDTNTTLDAILYLDNRNSLNKRGYFITSQFPASSFEDVFKDLLVSFRRFINSGDKIIIKYRTYKDPDYPITDPLLSTPITWSDTDTFTTDEDLSDVVVGNEVMFIICKGSGTTAHVSSISKAGTTYTVNLDETIPNVADTAISYISDWKKCATISTQGIERQGFMLDAVGTFIQLKVEMRSIPGGTTGNGQTPELKKIQITNQPEYEI